jgi:LysM repeat protein
MKRLACALALAGSAGAVAGVPCEARAAQTRATGGLQLSIITPDPTSIGDRLSLDVVCKGGPVETVELYLDNALVAQRKVGTTQAKSILSFSVDTLLLTAGAHDVMVKAIAPDGKSSSTTTRVRIPAADLSAPVRIAYPQNGMQVSGVVPIRVSLDSEFQRQKPYVTFFIDKEFKVLRNYPPYEYQWDTTKTANGWHLVEAMTQSGNELSPTKARPVNVNVNNSGGETKKQDKIQDIKLDLPGQGKTASAAKVSVPDSSLAQKSLGSTNPGTVETGSNVTGPSVRPQGGTDAVRSSEPKAFGYGSTSSATTNPGTLASRSLPFKGPQPQMSGGAAKQPATTMAVAAAPKGFLPGVGDPEALVPVIGPSRGGTDTTTTVRPGETLSGVAKRTGVNEQTLRTLNNVSKDGRLPSALVVPKAGVFDIAYNGTLVKFDVAPRIENGIRLAPFRQIFEHTGGRLYWYGGTDQTVRAINDRREIEIKIGDPKAIVNNHTVLMERKPFLDSGRTIVPLSFIKNAMDVKVTFDEKTGRLLIESVR